MKPEILFIHGPTPAFVLLTIVFSYNITTEQLLVVSRIQTQSRRYMRWPLDHHLRPMMIFNKIELLFQSQGTEEESSEPVYETLAEAKPE